MGGPTAIYCMLSELDFELGQNSTSCSSGTFGVPAVKKWHVLLICLASFRKVKLPNLIRLAEIQKFQAHVCPFEHELSQNMDIT